ncbi:MAG TPA: sarcosine oxidase subunit delta family protein, partial [Streptomyces sp.]|nr:sarcosine oxidase subunit delta family protein [Streptomyces sp.]
MLLITCPWCGPRDEAEFHYGGQGHVPYPETPSALTDEEWARYLFFRDNPKGPFAERWSHAAGCRTWFNAVRDTSTNEILAVYRAGEPRPAVEEPRRAAAPEPRPATAEPRPVTAQPRRPVTSRPSPAQPARPAFEDEATQPFRHATRGRIDRGTPLAFTFDGTEYQGYKGDTLASALLANGVVQTGTSIKLGRPRGI